jgi:uncharacterized protein with NRDE domain
VTRGGRVAALTNYREPRATIAEAESRGLLVSQFLLGHSPARAYAAQVHARGEAYNGFNLVVGDRHGWWYCSNRGRPPEPIGAGVHGLSNHLLDTPWPKVRRMRSRIEALSRSHQQVDPDQLMTMLDDRCQAPDSALPDTGVGMVWERALSSPFIVTPDYGTRSSSVIVIDARGHLQFSEQSFAADGSATARRDFSLALDPAGEPGLEEGACP